jgi:hypothetical protein
MNKREIQEDSTKGVLCPQCRVRYVTLALAKMCERAHNYQNEKNANK